MNEIKVSVIIPVYNVESYLRECLESILNQSLRELELICIDDGSTDGSLAILREFEKKDPRVQVLTQTNQGGGAARNKGIAIAKGKYLSFLDSDDFFETDMLESAYALCEQTDAQICVYRVMRYDTNTGKTYLDTSSWRKSHFSHKKLFSRKDMPDGILNTFQNWAWNKLIRHDLVKENNLRFQEIQRSNDCLFVAACMALAKCITTLDRPLVYYRVGMKNSCQSTNDQHPTEFLKAFLALKIFLTEHGIYEEVRKSYLNLVLSGCIYNLNSISNVKAKTTLYEELKTNAFFALDITKMEKEDVQEYNKKNYEAYLFAIKHSLEMYESRYGIDAMKTPRLYRQNTERKRKENMAKVSIIIPVYNVEQYLVECMESVLRQTLHDLEIICINDGSTDGSLEILQRYADADERIQIVDKENGGYGMGMNIGLDKATGEYIGIVEPDDYVKLTMYEDLYAVAKEHDLDMVKADFYRFKRDPNNKNMTMTYFALSKNPEDYNKIFDPSNQPDALRYVMNTWSGIYKREFIEKYHIRHHETPGASFQDNGFYFQTFVYARRAMILDKPYYINRRDNPNSSVHNRAKVYCMNEEYDYIRGLLEKDEKVWETFKYMYWKRKVDNYGATINRIGNEYKREYILHISEEYRQGQESGELIEDVFTKNQWDSIQFIIRDPEGYFYSIMLPSDMKTMTKELKDIKTSTSYKLGFKLTAIPRKIKKWLKKRKG